MRDIFNAHQRFSIRKFTVGVASVLIGTAFVLPPQVAQADEVVANDTAVSNATGTNVSSEATTDATATPATVDKTVLTTKVLELRTDLLTVPASDSTQVAKEALEQAQALLDSTTATQEDVDAAVTTLNAQLDAVKAEAAAHQANVTALKEVKTDLETYLPQAEGLGSDVTKAQSTLEAVTKALEGNTTEDLETLLKEAKTTRNSLVNVVTRANSGSRDPRNGESMGEGTALRAGLTNAEEASLPNDYNVTWTEDRLRETDPGFAWSSDGKTLIYRYDASQSGRITLTELLEKLKATPKDDSKGLRTVLGTDKGIANKKNDTDGFNKRVISGSGNNAVEAFTLNGKDVNILDLVKYPELWGGMTVNQSEGSLTTGNATFETATVAARNGAGEFTINSVAKPNNSSTTSVYNAQLYLVPSDVGKTLDDRGENKDTTTNVINMAIAPVLVIQAPTTPVIQVATSLTNTNEQLSNAEMAAIKDAFVKANPNANITANDVTVTPDGKITVNGQTFQADPSKGYITRYADIRTDYKVSWTSDKLDGRTTDPGFSWSPDGKTLIYRYDASNASTINLADALAKLKATPTNTTATPALRDVLGTDKANANLKNNTDGLNKKVITGNGGNAVEAFTKDGVIINVLDLVKTPELWGGQDVNKGQGALTSENATFTTANIEAANGADAFTIDGVATQNGTAKIYKSQLYLLPSDVGRSLTDRGLDKATTTNVINVVFAAVETDKVVPTVEIPYDDKDQKVIYVYRTEDNNVTVDLNDNSGKVATAEMKQASNQALNGQEYGLAYTNIDKVTDTPASLTISGVVNVPDQPEYGKDSGETGKTLMTRYVQVYDQAGNRNEGDSRSLSDTGYIQFKVRDQKWKYTADVVKNQIKSGDTLRLENPSDLTNNDLNSIKAKLNASDGPMYGKNADGSEGGRVANVAKDGDNLVVTYNDGSSVTVKISDVIDTERPTVEIPYDDKDQKVIYVYRTEDTNVTVGLNDNSGKVATAEMKQASNQALNGQEYGLAYTNIDKVTDTPTSLTISGVVNVPNQPEYGKDSGEAGRTLMTRYVQVYDQTGNRNEGDARSLSDTGYIQFKVRDQKWKYTADVVKKQMTSGDKLLLENPSNLTDNDLNAIKGKLNASDGPMYGKNADGSEGGRVANVAKDGDNLVVTYNDGSSVSVPIADVIDTVAPVVKIKYDDEANKVIWITPTEDFNSADRLTVTDNTGKISKVWLEQSGNGNRTLNYGLSYTEITSETDASETDPAKLVVSGKVWNTTGENGTGRAWVDGERALTRTLRAQDADGNISNAVGNGSGDAGWIDFKIMVQKTKYATDLANKADAATKFVQTDSNLSKEQLDTIKANLQAGDDNRLNGKINTVTQEGDKVIVTYNDGTKAEIPVDKFVNVVNVPANKVPVTTPLTGEQKAQIKKNVEDVNPGATVTVKDDGSVEVTPKDSTTPTTLTPAEVSKDAEKTATDGAILNPTDKVVVADKEKLSPDDLNNIKKAVEDANPGATVTVNPDGSAKVVLPDGKGTGVIPADKLVKTADDATKPGAGYNVNKPADKAVTADPTSPSDEAKKAAESNIKAVNPTAKTVTFDDKGNATVVLEDGTTAVIPAKDLFKTEEDAAKPNTNNVNKPADKAVTADPTSPSDEAKKAAEANIKAVNPTAKTVTFDDKGNATVVLEDGTTAVIPAKDLFKSEEDAAKPNTNNVNKPADKAVTADPTSPSDEAKKAAEANIKAVNPGANVVFDNNGNATVTLPDGTTAVIPASDLFKSEEDAAKPNTNNVNKPADKAVTADPTSPSDEAKKAAEANIKAVNPGANVVFDNNGNATVTLPDGTTAVIPAKDLFKSEEDAAKPNTNNVNKPAVKTFTTDPASPSDDAKKLAEANIKAVNPTAKTVMFDENGNATVVLADGTTAVIPASDIFKSDADADSINEPAKTPVADPSNLTDAEKAKVAAEVKTANPNVTDVVVNNDGTTIVTFQDGSKAVLTPDKTVEKATPGTNEDSHQDNGNKANQATLPNTGVDVSVTSSVLGAIAAATGGLLIGAKRKKDEE